MGLLSHYGFDLREWLQGRDTRSPLVILSMARNLPEDSLLTARLSAQRELAKRELKNTLPPDQYQELVGSQEELDEVDRLTSEKMSWSLLNSLVAMGINMMADGDKAVVGPSTWLKGNSLEEAVEKTQKPGRLESFFGGMGGG